MLHSKALAQFLSAHPLSKFKPVAYYDKHLDMIVVQLRDCSFCEISIDRRVSVFTLAGKDSVAAGFAFFGIRHSLSVAGIKMPGRQKLSAVLSACGFTRPLPSPFGKIIAKILDEHGFEIDLPL